MASSDSAAATANRSRAFPILGKSELPPAMQEDWERSLARRGEAAFIGGAGHAPNLYRWYADAFYGGLFHGGEAPVRYKELGRLRLSTVHGCRSCNLGNRLDARGAGLTDEQIRRIDDPQHPCFDAADQAVLALADLVSLQGVGAVLGAELYGALRRSFSDGQIFELGMVFGLLAGMAQFLFAFELVEREDGCGLAPQAPPPQAGQG